MSAYITIPVRAVDPSTDTYFKGTVYRGQVVIQAASPRAVLVIADKLKELIDLSKFVTEEDKR